MSMHSVSAKRKTSKIPPLALSLSEDMDASHCFNVANSWFEKLITNGNGASIDSAVNYVDFAAGHALSPSPSTARGRGWPTGRERAAAVASVNIFNGSINRITQGETQAKARPSRHKCSVIPVDSRVLSQLPKYSLDGNRSFGARQL